MLFAIILHFSEASFYIFNCCFSYFPFIDDGRGDKNSRIGADDDSEKEGKRKIMYNFAA